MLDQITPVLLTQDEAENIRCTLSKLTWANDIVVVDSGSTDGTLQILAEFSHVRVFHRPFDTHASQWRYAVNETAIATPWVLRLDADYIVTDALINELARLDPYAPVNGYRIAFDYAIFSRRLISSLYPPKTVLLRKGHFSVWDRGHTEAWTVEGDVATLKGRIVHDDWKRTGPWVRSQIRYMEREAETVAAKSGGMRGWLRRHPPFAPIAVFIYCLFGKGLIFNGRAGVYYALQRLVAEAVLSLILLEKKLRAKSAAKRDANGNREP
jgi:glycosyltransferase involved in cell wall biosynthesis